MEGSAKEMHAAKRSRKSPCHTEIVKKITESIFRMKGWDNAIQRRRKERG